MSSFDDLPLTVSPEVASALATGKAVVGLETTILSFGLPHPLNVQVGSACEARIRENNAVPATLAILAGSIRVGISPSEIENLCRPDIAVKKTNLQNLAGVICQQAPGALTVAASLRVCTLAGIRVFATGGIGGVHRGFEQTLDISSDLTALSRYPVVTVCSGAKSILDIPKTLEALETLGVPIVGYGTRTLPLFYSSQSSYKLELSFDEPEAMAHYLQVHFSATGTGAVVVVPVPEKYALPLEEVESWTKEALKAARLNKVEGKAETPFLLKQMEIISEGRTLKTNAALVCNNALTAALIAKAMGQ